MLNERRRIRRHIINRVAQYHSGLGALPRACLVTDISEGGARLYSDTPMPDAFTLTLDGEQAETRECRVAWRLGGEVGVEFTDRRRR